MKKILDRINETRGHRSVVAFARDIGMTQQTVDNYISGRQKPSLLFVYNICCKFNVSADWLFGLSDRREGGVKIIQDPKILEENNGLKANIVNLQAELHRLQGEINGLNKALELMSKK